MIRSGAAAPLGRSSLRYVSSSANRNTSNLVRAQQLRSKAPRSVSPRQRPNLSLVLRKPLSTSLQRHATYPGNPFDKIDTKHEEAVEREKLEPHPEEVSTTSSVHQVFHEKGVEEGEKDEDMLAGVKADLVCLIVRIWLGFHDAYFNGTENDQRNLRPQRGSPRSACHWHGWRLTVPGDIPLNCLPRLRYQSRL